MVDKKHYENVWKAEGLQTWRLYPQCFNKISFFVGSKKRVLDVGCGVGILMRKLKDNGNQVWGVDISRKAVEIVQSQEMSACESEVPPLPGVDNFFDVVVATEMFEHVEDDEELLNECVRVLKRNGWLVVAVPNNVLGPEEEKEHVRKYTKESLIALLEKGGRKVYVEEFVEQFSPAGWKNRNGDPMVIRLPTLIGRVKKI